MAYTKATFPRTIGAKQGMEAQLSALQVLPDELLVVQGTIPVHEANLLQTAVNKLSTKPLAVVCLPDGVNVASESAPNDRTRQLMHAVIFGDCSPDERCTYLTELVSQHSPASILTALKLDPVVPQEVKRGMQGVMPDI